MRERLCKFVCCPACRTDLHLKPSRSEGAEILEGTFTCSKCGSEYPIRRGVPRFVTGSLSRDSLHTAKNFGRSWEIWSGIHDETYIAQFLSWVQPLRPEDFKDRIVLDCGCGKGRHLRAAVAFGARDAIGFDLSDAVDVSYANTRELQNVHVVQADIYNLPFRGGFDLAYSVGVLHHTPDPETAFKSVVKQVRPAGIVAVWVYGRENNGWIVYLVNPLRLGITRYLPPPLLKASAFGIAAVISSMIALVYSPIQRMGFTPFYGDYMLYLKRLGFRETSHIVYDHLTAPTAVYLRKEQIADWFSSSGIEDAKLTWVRKISWSATGTRGAREG